MIDQELLHKNLIVSILALASNKQSQIDFTTPGCVICDLTEDFETYGKRCYNTSNYNLEQNNIVNDLNESIQKFCDAGFECFDLDVLDSLEWEEIRTKASKGLQIFGYAFTDLPKNVNTGNGVWRIDISLYQLKKV